MIQALHASISLVYLLAQTPPPVLPGSEDDGAPMLLMMVLLLGVIGVCLVLIGVGIVLALMGVGCVALLTALGILSSSAVVALWQRRVTAGVRALHYQVCAVLGAPAGAAGLWAVNALSGYAVRLRWVLPAGVAAGALAGLGLAAVGDWALRTAYRRLQQRALSRDTTFQDR